MLSQHDYTYSADGKIATWQEQTDSNTPLLWTYGYDAANQLTSAVLTNTAITTPPVRSDTYNYDAAGNPSTFDIGTVLRSPSSNALNQLTGSTPGGNQTVVFTGALNGAATVTVNGTAATVNPSHYFSGSASLAPGTTTTVPVVATDAQGNSRTNHYQTIVPAELTYSPTYDADGNELTNGAGQSYTWDAKNELITITYTGGTTSNFAYDALGRRTSIVEKNSSGTVTSTKQLVWNGSTLAEERDGSNMVTKRFFAQGEQIGTSSYYYTHDHLGSVREMTDSAGAIQARYDYDPYGRARLVQGTLASDFQYAGYYEHAASGLNLTLFRAYDPNTAKWLSRDPLGERIGPNLYGYVRNNPIDYYDPWGLDRRGGSNTHGSPGNPCGTDPAQVLSDVAGDLFLVFFLKVASDSDRILALPAQAISDVASLLPSASNISSGAKSLATSASAWPPPEGPEAAELISTLGLAGSNIANVGPLASSFSAMMNQVSSANAAAAAAVNNSAGQTWSTGH